MNQRENKKLLCLFLAAAVLAASGCRKKEEPEAPPEETEVPYEDTVWAVKPVLDLDDVRPLEGFRSGQLVYTTGTGSSQLIITEHENVGYPQTWGETGYTTDAVIVEKGGYTGIYDYAGNELYPVSIRVNTTPFSAGITSAYRLYQDTGSSDFVFGAADTSTSKAYVFSSDFREAEEIPYSEFISDPMRNVKTTAQVCTQAGVLGVLYRESGSSAKQLFERYNGTKLTGNTVAYEINGSFARTGTASIVDEDGNYYAAVVNGRGSYREGTYINGFYLSGSKNEIAFFNAAYASQISYDYHDAMYFEDGYAPVKLYGKWGFIDTQGNEVTDFIFDDVTPLYQGRAYVKYNGTWGILNIKKSLEDGKQLNLATCYSEEDESRAIGTITVNIRNLNFRENAGTGGINVGIANKGSVYPVYEIVENDGYTWYRVDGGHWLADNNGEWLTYTK